MVLALDIGGTHVRTGIMDKENRVIFFNSRYTKDIVKEPVLENLSRYIAGIPEIVKNWKRIKKVVLGIPSIIDDDNDSVLSTPNVPLLQNIKLKTGLKKLLKKDITILNDVNLSTLGEYSILDHELFPHVVGIYIGTGIGCGIIINKRLYTGGSNLAAEYGHIPTRIRGRSEQCGCGLYNCLELNASGNFLARSLAGSDRKYHITEIFIDYESDPLRKKIVDTFFDYLAFGLYTLITILNPDLLIMGGGVINMDHFPRERLISSAYSRLRHPSLKNKFQVKFAELGEKAFLYGSKEYFNNYQ